MDTFINVFKQKNLTLPLVPQVCLFILSLLLEKHYYKNIATLNYFPQASSFMQLISEQKEKSIYSGLKGNGLWFCHTFTDNNCLT